jgi:hypothetical protein
MMFLSHEISNARSDVQECRRKIEQYKEDLEEYLDIEEELTSLSCQKEQEFYKECRDKEEHRHMTAVNEWLKSRPEVGTLNGGEVGLTYQTPTRFYRVVDYTSESVEVFSL